MKDSENMTRVIEYINSHIHEPITIDDLANIAGYSFHHFCHIFTSYTGIPAGTYLQRKRMEMAAGVLTGGATTSQAAAATGFDTASGFAKAFRKHYGMSPTEYKKLHKGELEINPEFRHMPGFPVVGYCLPPPQHDYDTLDVGAYWHNQDFSSVSKDDYARLTYPGYAEIGAWIRPNHNTGEFFYFFGPVVKDKTFVPRGMEVIDVPEAEYAVFPVSGGNLLALNSNVRSMWKYIFFAWLPDSGYLYDENAVAFEYYQGEQTYIYVPVVKP